MPAHFLHPFVLTLRLLLNAHVDTVAARVVRSFLLEDVRSNDPLHAERQESPLLGQLAQRLVADDEPPVLRVLQVLLLLFVRATAVHGAGEASYVASVADRTWRSRRDASLRMPPSFVLPFHRHLDHAHAGSCKNKLLRTSS